MICKICNKNESQYKCPKCTIEYCSLTCFKDQKHSRCTEKFYQDQIKESLKAEKVGELSDEREKMLKILEKLKNLTCEDDDDIETDETDAFYEALEDLNLEELDGLSVEDLEEILGEKHLKHVEELIEKGVTEEWLTAADLLNQKQEDPWFKRFKPSSIVLNEDLPDYLPKLQENIPDIKDLTKKTPSDFLWNNLLEICVIYSFIYTQFTRKELENSQILKNEVQPILMELCASLLKKESLFTSALEALETSKSVISFNSSDHDFNEILSNVLNLLQNPKMLILMLTDLVSWFNVTKINAIKPEFYAKKKLEFLRSWLNSETEQSKTSVEEILKMLSNIVEKFKE